MFRRITRLIVFAAVFGMLSAVCAAQPNLQFSYTPSSGTPVNINAGGTLAFSATNVNSTSQVTFVISNQGALPTVLSSIVVSSNDFAVSGLTTPAQVNPQGVLTFTLTFKPTAAGNRSGTLTLTLDGTATAFSLAGQGLAPTLVYEFTSGDKTVALTPGQTLTVPDTAVGQTSDVSVSVRNAGNTAGQVNSIFITGSSFFQLQGVPNLPQSIGLQQSIPFNLHFAPTDVGVVTGTLRIDGATFPIAGTGLGPKYGLSVTISGITTIIADNGAIEFPNTVIGSDSLATATISNSGNQPLTVSNITASGGNFFTPTLPTLPVLLQPGATSTFTIRFVPDQLGILTGSLLVSGRTYILRGSGSGVLPLPAVQFGDVPSQAASLQQPFVSLKLVEPYPYDVQGTLAMAFTSDTFVDDPTIQFAAGGRALTFKIPANTTDAVFGTGNVTKVPFQTGTVFGTITFTAGFTVQKVPVTPTNVPTQAVVIPSAAPQLRQIQLGTVSSASFELLISGFATTRQISSMQLQFTPAAGTTTKAQTLSVDVSSAFSGWYQNTGSRAYGSQFTASITILLSGQMSDFQSVAVTASNSLGTSAAISANLK